MLFDPVTPFWRIYPKNPKTPCRNNICTPVFIAAIVTIAKIWKQPKCPSVDEWIKKMWYIYTMEYYVTVKKNELTLASVAQLVGASSLTKRLRVPFLVRAYTCDRQLIDVSLPLPPSLPLSLISGPVLR